jgi:hypothetical protein
MMIRTKRKGRIAGFGAIGFRFLLAWVAGIGIYMLAMAMTVYDGILSLIFQPFAAAVVSFLFLVIIMLTSLLLLIPPVRRLWHEHVVVALSVLAVGIVLVTCSFVCIEVMVNSAGEQNVERFGRLGATTVVLGTLLVMFALANWPPQLFPPPFGLDESKPMKPDGGVTAEL